MRPHLSLTTKVLAFVIVPLVVQLCLLFVLRSLSGEAEQALRVSDRSRKISDTINEIAADIFELHKRYRTMSDLQKNPMTDDMGRLLIKRLKDDYADLRKLTKHQPEIADAVRKSEEVVDRSLDRFASIQNRLSQMKLMGAGPIGANQRAALINEFRSTGRDDTVFQNLIDVGKEQRRRAEQAPEEQAAYRERMHKTMLGIGITILFIGVMNSLFLIKGITTRLKRVNENTYKLASGLPLHPVLTGADEIARLDQVFHKMAAEMQESSRKQTAMIDNARDLICSIDEQGRFIAVNPASFTLLKIPPDDLLGKHFIDLVVETDVAKTLTYLEELKAQANPAPLELEMRTSSGETVETLWSAHWSQEESSIFCVIHDTTDRRRAEKLKQEVVAMITHDLRTPLSVINNVLGFFESRMSGTFDDKGRNYVLMARRNADRMGALINDLLDIEKIKSGMVELEIATVPLNRCLENCRDVSVGFAEELGVVLEFETTSIVLEVDEKRIDRVLSNLVSNAIKFSPKGKTVKVSAEERDGSVWIKVDDEGAGIPAEMRESVFERFQQVGGGTAAGKGGSGLGLTICKAIVELHGGEIWVEGKDPGSRFIFSLPLATEG